jgi:hypothetical protein
MSSFRARKSCKFRRAAALPQNTSAHNKRTTGAGMLLNGRACDQIFFAEFGFDPAGWEVLFCTKSAMTAYVEQRVPIRAVAR